MALYKYFKPCKKEFAWIAVFSSAYKLFTNNWYPCVLVYMISSDATTRSNSSTALVVELVVMLIGT